MSSFCLTQRSQQYQNSQKIVVLGSACSLFIHTAVIAAWKMPLSPDAVELEPIELIVVDPSPTPAVSPPPATQPKPKPIPDSPPPPAKAAIAPPPPIAQPEPLPTTPPPPPAVTAPPVFTPIAPPVEQAISAPPLPQTATVAPTLSDITPPPLLPPAVAAPPVLTPIASPVEQSISAPPPLVNPLANSADVPIFLPPAAQSPFRPPALSAQEFAPLSEPMAAAVAPSRLQVAPPKTLGSSSAPTLNRSSASTSSRPTPSAAESMTAIANPNAVSQGAPPIKPGTATQPIASSSHEARPQIGSRQNQAGRPGDRTPGKSATPIAANSATNSAPPPPAPPPKPPAKPQPLKCVSQCTPTYPTVLQGEEGSVKVIVSLNDSGVVTDARLAAAHGNSEINSQALLAAKKMRFTAPAGGQNKSVPVVIHFTVAGSDFDRQARERRQQQEQLRQAARQAEQEKANQERQARLEAEQQARQRQLEKERQERLKPLSVESIPNPAVKPSPPPSPSVPPRSTVESPPSPDPVMGQEVQVEGLGANVQLEF